jgi:acyl-coenzyme A synthetase/AMP-(fatty) acid ligase
MPDNIITKYFCTLKEEPLINIYNLVKKNNENNSQKTALSITMDNGKQRIYTYTEFFKKVDTFADRLSSANICIGDRVALVAENLPEWNIA